MSVGDKLPAIIQGGMGVGVSGWRLARAVSRSGQMGVVSGTVLDVTFARRLQLGDPGGVLRSAIQKFPDSEMAQRVIDAWFVPGGISSERPFKAVPVWQLRPSPKLVELGLVATFCEVHLAKRGHSGVVGINLMDKLRLPMLAGIYGAMLAGVEYILMGAGIPTEASGAIDRLSENKRAEMSHTLEDGGESQMFSFDPADYFKVLPQVRRPSFFPIISTHTLAAALLRRSRGKVDGFIIEAPVAGGHNAPPRGDSHMSNLDEEGEPIYGERDVADLQRMEEIGLPFWLAGGEGTPSGLASALKSGACGIQAGTPFALSRESGLIATLKSKLISGVSDGSLEVKADPLASPTGFPFRVAQLAGTMSDAAVEAKRKAICDLGYLRRAFKNDHGKVQFRCPSEPVDDYVSKGGSAEDTKGRMCLCNGLAASIGLGQRRPEGFDEPPVITLGSDLGPVREILGEFGAGYSAVEVVRYLTRGIQKQFDLGRTVSADAG